MNTETKPRKDQAHTKSLHVLRILPAVPYTVRQDTQRPRNLVGRLHHISIYIKRVFTRTSPGQAATTAAVSLYRQSSTTTSPNTQPSPRGYHPSPQTPLMRCSSVCWIPTRNASGADTIRRTQWRSWISLPHPGRLSSATKFQQRSPSTRRQSETC